MDLGKVERQLARNSYNSAEEFAADVRLTFVNAKTYNVEFSDIHQMAKVVESHFEEKFGGMFKGSSAQYLRVPLTPDCEGNSKKRQSSADAKQAPSKKARKEESEDEMSDVSNELPEEPTEEEKVVKSHD